MPLEVKGKKINRNITKIFLFLLKNENLHIFYEIDDVECPHELKPFCIYSTVTGFLNKYIKDHSICNYLGTVLFRNGRDVIHVYYHEYKLLKK